MRILFIEPDEYYHAKFSETVSDLGQVEVASTSQHANNLLDGWYPDAVVMELALPDRSGYTLLQRLKREYASLPVIIFSSTDHPEDIEAALNFGVTGYFVKGKDNLSDIRKLLLIYST